MLSACACVSLVELHEYPLHAVLGMLLAAEAYRRAQGAGSILCCKLHHDNDQYTATIQQ